MKNKIINAMLYTYSYILFAIAVTGIISGAYFLVEMILANLQ